MEQKLQKLKHEIVLSIVTGLLLFSGLGKIEVNIMEARNFIAAREMVQNKEYLLTTLNNEPRYQKPPLPTWLTAVSGAVFGFESLFALRIPVVAITFLLVFIFWYFSKLIGLNPGQSLNNALILISSFYIFFAGRDNQWDMYTHSLMMVCIYFLWKLLSEDGGELRNSILAGIFLGLSFLSKGPISLYVLLLPFLISFAVVYHFSFRKKILYLLYMFLAGLVIGSSWYIYVSVKDPVHFKMIATRETSNWSSYEVKPFYYYWNFFIQSGLWTIPSLTALIYPYLRKRVENIKAYRFAILWTIVSFIFLSLVPEKKIRYLVPVLIPLALTTGFYIDYLIKNFSSITDKREKAWIFFSFGIIALIGFAYPFTLAFLFKSGILEYLALFIVSTLLIWLLSFFIIKGLVDRNFLRVFYSTISVFILIVMTLIPLRAELSLNPGFSSARDARVFEEQYNVRTYGLNEVVPEIIWDFGKSIPILKVSGDQIQVPPQHSFALVAPGGDSAVVRNRFAGYRIEKKYRIDLNYDLRNKDRLIKDYYILTKQ
ncbi:MAG: glycosyltransferase family 39 protein [Bacteroidales bacterium]